MAGSARRSLVRRLTTSQWFALAAALLALVTAAGAALGVVAIMRLTDARNTVLDRNGPAVLAQMQLATALVDQESGVRGYALTGRDEFLEPYRAGRAVEREQLVRMRELLRGEEMAPVRRTTALMQARAQAWRRVYADPVIASIRARGPSGGETPDPRAGQRAFDAVREALALQSAALERVRIAGRTHFTDMADFLTVAFAAIVVLIAIGIVGAVIMLRVTTTRPLRRLGRGVRRIARGEFGHELERGGALDVVQLTDDVSSMRERIVAELSSLREMHEQLDEQARELARSNAELEQFAYVASHDLQEPLRKVASFCQLLEQRYGDQLDERGRQYVGFAVDGAKRMQQLINDLLAFSRVGRGTGELPLVDGDNVLSQALASLAESIEETRAEIVAGPLPRVRAEPALLAAVFQNLIGNALKFRSDGRAPRVQVSASRRDGEWLFTCADDGIGIEPEYADRIFMIFQRLHPKDAYVGTGIGLAMCRKIVEYHGGRIWLDTESANGRTTFCFTLPAIDTTEEPA